MASLPWSILMFSGENGKSQAWSMLDGFLKARLGHVEPVLAGREWLAQSFSVADILMADVLRLVDRFDALGEFPACRAYLAAVARLDLPGDEVPQLRAVDARLAALTSFRLRPVDGRTGEFAATPSSAARRPLRSRRDGETAPVR